MRITLRMLAAFLALSLLPSPAAAWGFEAHRFIMRHAIELLPAELKPFFQHHRDEVVVRVVDPDLWRNVGWPENQHHFLDFGVKEYGEYPFDLLPREYDRALQKFGRETLERNGTLPWRLSELFGMLRRAFEAFSRNSPYAVNDTVLFASIVSHYIQDAHQPLHATDNYDGARTGQRGVHARFEWDLFERYSGKLAVKPAAARRIASPRDAAFDVLIESHRLVPQLLEADKAALGRRDRYDDAYYEAFFAGTRPLLEQRINEAITATASLILSAWEEAGRPTLWTQVPRTGQRAGSRVP